MSQPAKTDREGISKMSDTVISFTTLEFPNEELMEKTYEVFHDEMQALADKLRSVSYTHLTQPTILLV